MRALEKSYRREILFSALCTAYSYLIRISHAFIISLFITYFTRRNENREGWQYTFGAGAGIIAISTLITISSTLATAHMSNRISAVGANMKTSVDSLILQKAFVISPLARRKVKENSIDSIEWTDGVVLNILNVDSERILSALRDIHSLWMPFFLLPYVIGLAYWFIGWAGIAGACVTFAFYPLLWLGSKLKANLTVKLNSLNDYRSNLINDVIKNIRFIKYVDRHYHLFYYTLIYELNS